MNRRGFLGALGAALAAVGLGRSVVRAAAEPRIGGADDYGRSFAEDAEPWQRVYGRDAYEATFHMYWNIECLKPPLQLRLPGL